MMGRETHERGCPSPRSGPTLLAALELLQEWLDLGALTRGLLQQPASYLLVSLPVGQVESANHDQPLRAGLFEPALGEQDRELDRDVVDRVGAILSLHADHQPIGVG